MTGREENMPSRDRTLQDEQLGADHRLVERIAAKEARKLRARRERARSIWFGLGMFGMVGWSVAVPALIGTAIGYWIDRRTAGTVSWTLTGLLVGMAVGASIAWNWIKKEGRIE